MQPNARNTEEGGSVGRTFLAFAPRRRAHMGHSTIDQPTLNTFIFSKDSETWSMGKFETLKTTDAILDLSEQQT